MQSFDCTVICNGSVAGSGLRSLPLRCLIVSKSGKRKKILSVLFFFFFCLESDVNILCAVYTPCATCCTPKVENKNKY